MTQAANAVQASASATGTTGTQVGGTIWTEWHENPFMAIKAAAIARGKPEDYEKALDELRKSAEWPLFWPDSYLDELLQEIAGATNIVCQYDSTEIGAKPKFRAAYDD